MMRFPHPTLTPARRAWLELVERDGDDAPRSFNSPVTAHCLRLGWVEPLRIVAGVAYPESEFQRNFPAGTRAREMAMRAFDGYGGFRITEDGRQALADARARETV